MTEATVSCATGADPSSALGAVRPTYGVFSGTLTLTGEIAVHGAFTDMITSRGETCAAYVRGLAPAITLFVVPTPANGTIVGGHTVMYVAGIPSDHPSAGYHGPATYSGVSGVVTGLFVDDASFLPDARSTAVITIEPDASGALSFTGLQDTETHARESGHATWTCAD